MLLHFCPVRVLTYSFVFSRIMIMTFMRPLTLVCLFAVALLPSHLIAQGNGGQRGLLPSVSQAGAQGVQPRTYQAIAPQQNQAVPATQSQTPRQPLRPFPPLTEKHEQYLDQVLKFWEFKSDQVKHYECRFKRWEFDPVFGPRDVHKTYSTGVIKYAAPDKGLFRVDDIYHYTPAKPPETKPGYFKHEGEKGEHWICDGTSIFDFDYRQKQLNETKLPPDMQGKAIVDGPLPFLFGANAEKIKSRYWLRIVTPANVEGEYWLEAFPKRMEDAVNFKKIEVIIDEKDYLPKAIQVYDRNYDPKGNPARTVFMFEDRTVNALVNNLNRLNLFHREFFRPATPSGWETLQRGYGAPEPQPTQNTATRPGVTPTALSPTYRPRQ